MVHAHRNLQLDKVRATLRRFSQRQLSYHGRAVVVKQFALAKVWYLARTLTMPKVIQKDLEKMIWKYMWRNSAPLVKRSVCVSAIDSGGLSFPHIEAKMTAIRCSWFKKILDPQSSSMIKRYAIHWLSKLSGIYKMELNVFGMPYYEPPARALTKLPAFYRQTYNDWRKLKEEGTFNI